jgi:hypothetical protein
MRTKPVVSLDRAAEHFVNYLFEEYQGSKHVCRVLPWLGFLLFAVDRVADGGMARFRTRQMTFKYRGRKFKTKYDHHVGAKGGIVFVEILPGRGMRQGDVAVIVTNLKQARGVYKGLKTKLDRFIDEQEAQ